jgi:hypothetical protein
MLLAPLIWAGVKPAAVYNIQILLSFWLNGIATAQLLRGVGLNRPAAAAGGLFVQWLPFVHWQLGVMQLVPLYSEAWAVLALWRLIQSPGVKQGVLLGAAFGLSFLNCQNHALFFGVLLGAVTVVVGGRSLLARRFWIGAAVSLIVAAVFVAPAAIIQLRAFRGEDFHRSRELMISLSAHPGDYSLVLHSPVKLPDFAEEIRRPWWPMSPGWLKVALAALGLSAGLASRSLRRWTVFAAVFVGAAFLLSLGPEARWKTLAPYDFLVNWAPGFDHVRNVFRFAIFAQLGMAWLAAGGLNAILGWITGPSCSNEFLEIEASQWRRGTALATCLLVTSAACAESWPLPQRYLTLPGDPTPGGWISFLSALPPDAVVAGLPFPASNEVEDYEVETWWMYWQMFHHRTLANGYSGYFPPAYLRLSGDSALFPKAYAVNELLRTGVQYVVVDMNRLPGMEDAVNATGDGRIELVVRDESARALIYRLRARPVESVP